MLNLGGTHNPIGHAVSDYGVGPTRRLFTIYSAVGTLAVLLLAAAVLQDARLPDRAGIYLLLNAALRVALTLLPTDPEGAARTRTGRLHLLSAIGSFAFAYMAIDVLYPAAMPLASGWAAPVLSVLRWAVMVSLAGVVLCMLPPFRRVFGLVERAFILAVPLWQLAFAVAILTGRIAG